MRVKGRRLFIITGLSGAGKSQALKFLEDFGFSCVDNLPVSLIGSFEDQVLRSSRPREVALGLDVRGGGFLKGFAGMLEDLRQRGLDCRVLFLDASDETLVQRFSETRHRHPLGRNILQAIRAERESLTEIKGLADKVIDTSSLTLGELKEQVSFALGTRRTREMHLSVVSFGYKHGLPLDADIVMDVRFLPNPNYRPKLKRRTGLDRTVQRYIMRRPIGGAFLKQFLKLVRSVLPHYVREGKSYFTLAVGCTGGRHRSVFVAHHMARLLQKSGYPAREFHRDIRR
ncbi:MAG: RNase adapter RapZ [Elusimicrobiota bacterium]